MKKGERRTASQGRIKRPTAAAAARSTIPPARTSHFAPPTSRATFLAKLSHELKTPLSAVLGLTDVLLDESHGPLNEQQKKLVSTILVSGRHLQELVNDLLDLSMVDAGHLRLQYGDVDVAELVEQCVAVVSEVARKREQTIIVDPIVGTSNDEDPLIVYADSRRIKQALLNLLANAINFAGVQGRIRIRMEVRDSDLILSVSDSGPGISVEDQSRLFQPFVAISSEHSPHGTGLGLALVRAFAELHEGRAWLTSVPTEGATFFIAIPLRVSDKRRP